MTHNKSVISSKTGAPIVIKAGEAGAVRFKMLSAIRDAVKGGNSFYCDLEMASRQTMVVDAIQQSCSIQIIEGETHQIENG